jgi:3-oxoacyl-[acyl-carrier protein] reductase
VSDLSNKVALVTGAARGIGAGIARRIARDGAKVVVNYSRSAEAAGAVVQSIRKAGGEAIAIRADLGEPQQIAPMIEAGMKAFGRLDILVNNAAVGQRMTLDQVTPEGIDRQFAVNVRGLLLACSAAAKVMSDGGRMINLSSGIVRARVPGSAIYAGTKAAVESITRCLAAELGPRGITVNAVSPGLVQTDMLASSVPEAVQKMLVAQTPLGRLGNVDDIADVVAFLASDDARWISGEVIPVNGGLG